MDNLKMLRVYCSFLLLALGVVLIISGTWFGWTHRDPSYGGTQQLMALACVFIAWAITYGGGSG